MFVAFLSTSLRNTFCVGISESEIQNIQLPEVTVSISAAPGSTQKILTGAQKQLLIGLLQRNTQDWTQSWHTPRGYQNYIHFKLNEKLNESPDESWISGLGAGKTFLARGACQRDLSASDSQILKSLLDGI